MLDLNEKQTEILKEAIRFYVEYHHPIFEDISEKKEELKKMEEVIILTVIKEINK